MPSGRCSPETTPSAESSASRLPDNTSTWDSAADRKGRRLPRTLLEAIDAFDEDPLVRDTFPHHLVEDYLAMKRQEWEEYHADVSPWEVDRYLFNV